MNLFTIDLCRKPGNPLYEQLYRFISGEIRAGRLLHSERLPSKKALAAHLKISVSTVEAAYTLLLQEGYVYTRPRSGYYVSPIDGLIQTEAIIAPPVQAQPPAYQYDFGTNAVDPSSFPYRTWAKLSRETLLDGSGLLTRGDPRGDDVLRETLARYLRAFRGVVCGPDQIVIGAGIEYLLTLLTALLGSGATFALENPGYTKAAAVIQNSGGHLRHISLDNEGMEPQALAQSGANVAYLTPSHQFPTGIVMPVGRRYQLLNWAAGAEGRYLIEDDYNSEFTFTGRPIPAMQGMDPSSRVIYMSTFSRTLAPSIRIAYMVLPASLSARFARQFGGYASTVSRFEQHTLMRFISGGYLERHLNRVKGIYKKRRDFLIRRLRTLDPELKVTGGQTGLHLLVHLPESQAEAVIRRGLENRIRILRLSDYDDADAKGFGTFIFGFSGMDEDQLDKAVALLFG